MKRRKVFYLSSGATHTPPTHQKKQASHKHTSEATRHEKPQACEWSTHDITSEEASPNRKNYIDPSLDSSNSA